VALTVGVRNRRVGPPFADAFSDAGSANMKPMSRRNTTQRSAAREVRFDMGLPSE
jgi:hypothetical protein